MLNMLTMITMPQIYNIDLENQQFLEAGSLATPSWQDRHVSLGDGGIAILKREFHSGIHSRSQMVFTVIATKIAGATGTTRDD